MYENVRYISAGRLITRDAWIHQSRIINSHEIMVILNGEVHIAVGDDEYTLVAGNVLHIAPGIPHRGTKVSEDKVSFYWIHYLGDTPMIPQYMNQTTPSRTELLCKQLLHCVSTDSYPPECADYYVRILLMELLAQQKESRIVPNVLCADIEEWIRGNSDRPIKVSDVASYFGFNPDYLNRVFRRHHPEGIKAYIDTSRCQRIRRDLSSSDMSLQQIAQKYGFQEYKYFLKYFRFHEGITPTEYRNAYYKTHINRK